MRDRRGETGGGLGCAVGVVAAAAAAVMLAKWAKSGVSELLSRVVDHVIR